MTLFSCLLAERSVEAGEIRSILKPDQSPMSSDMEVRSILKSGAVDASFPQSTAGPGILKDATQKPPPEASETRSILKKDSSFEIARTEPEKSVLKKESTFERVQATSSRGILKDSSFETERDGDPPGILKSPSKKHVYGVISGAQPSSDADTTQRVATETSSVTMTTVMTSHESGTTTGSQESWSTAEESESSSRVTHIKNEAVARRHMQNIERDR